MAAAGELDEVPDEVKRLTVRLYAHWHGVRTLIETGTYRGDTVEAVCDSFDTVHSVELHQGLHEATCQRFAGVANLRLHREDSVEVLPRLLSDLREPALFWLKEHYSTTSTALGRTDTPVLDELSAIMTLRVDGHVVLIDDALMFNGTPVFPTLAVVRRVV